MKAKPDKLITEVIQSVMGAQTFRKATKELSPEGKDRLSRSIGMDVDVWRQEFGAKLRETGDEILSLLRSKADEIKPDALAYTLAVVVDKASALDGRNSIQAASVNVQVNNYGPLSRDALMAELEGLNGGKRVKQVEGKDKNVSLD